MSTSPLLGLSYWLPGTSSPQSYQNDAVTRMDLFGANTVISRSVTAQPGSPTVGDAYIIPASATGTDWATFTAGDLVQAIKDATGTSVTYWVAYTPVTGLPIYVQDEADMVAWDGAAYQAVVSVESDTPIRNVTGVTLSKGAAVRISGSNGNTPTVSLARADAEATLPCAGLIVADVGHNSNGRIIRSGPLSGIDTSAFTEGDQLWVSSSVAGGFTNTAPVYPNFAQRVGIVTRSGVGNGSILVDIVGLTTTAGATGRELLSTATPAAARTVLANAFSIGTALDGNQVVTHSNGVFQHGIYTGATASANLTATGTAGQRGDMTISIYNNSGGDRTLAVLDSATSISLTSVVLATGSTWVVNLTFNGAVWNNYGGRVHVGDRRGN